MNVVVVGVEGSRVREELGNRRDLTCERCLFLKSYNSNVPRRVRGEWGESILVRRYVEGR